MSTIVLIINNNDNWVKALKQTSWYNHPFNYNHKPLPTLNTHEKWVKISDAKSRGIKYVYNLVPERWQLLTKNIDLYLQNNFHAQYLISGKYKLINESKQ